MSDNILTIKGRVEFERSQYEKASTVRIEARLRDRAKVVCEALNTVMGECEQWMTIVSVRTIQWIWNYTIGADEDMDRNQAGDLERKADGLLDCELCSFKTALLALFDGHADTFTVEDKSNLKQFQEAHDAAE